MRPTGLFYWYVWHETPRHEVAFDFDDCEISFHLGTLYIMGSGLLTITYTTANSPLTNNNVWALAIDGNDRLWFATSDGVFRLTPGTPDSWDTYNVVDGLADETVYAVSIENDNIIWFGTGSNLLD